MAFGDSMSYLPALSRLMGEVESPTQTQGMQQPQFGGSPEQLMQMMQSPQMQQQLQHWGVNFDPSQMRQSPFLPNSFMQGHPQLGHTLTGMMANAAATPEAPMVSGAGSGISRAMQGMMGGPEMLRQYQIRQMLSPMQMIGAQIPAQEFQRKQELLNLLTQMEKDRQNQAQQALQWHMQQPQRIPGIGLLMPGAQTPVPPEMQGQTPRSAGVGEKPLMGNMFQGQGQQPFQEQGQPYMQYYDPNMMKRQTEAQHPERQAGADLKKEQGKTEESKRQLNKAKAGQADRSPGGGRGGAGKDYGKDYDAIEKDVEPKVQALQRALQAAKTPEDKKFLQSQIDDLNRNRETRKGNIDKQRGDPGASARGLVGSGANTQQEDYSSTHELRDGPQGYGWYLKGQATPPPPAPKQ